jgi:hypothetical protein
MEGSDRTMRHLRLPRAAARAYALLVATALATIAVSVVLA